MVNREPDVAVSSRGVRAPAVHTHANAKRRRPWLGRQRTLRVHGCLDRVVRLGERREELVGAHVDDAAVVGLDRLLEERAMPVEHRAIAGSELGEQPRRSLDVGEEQGEMVGALVGIYDEACQLMTVRPASGSGNDSASATTASRAERESFCQVWIVNVR